MKTPAESAIDTNCLPQRFELRVALALAVLLGNAALVFGLVTTAHDTSAANTIAVQRAIEAQPLPKLGTLRLRDSEVRLYGLPKFLPPGREATSY